MSSMILWPICRIENVLPRAEQELSAQDGLGLSPVPPLSELTSVSLPEGLELPVQLEDVLQLLSLLEALNRYPDVTLNPKHPPLLAL